MTLVAWPWDVAGVVAGGLDERSDADQASCHVRFLVRRGCFSARIQVTAEDIPCRTVRYHDEVFTVCECPAAGKSGDEALRETILFDDNITNEWSYGSPSLDPDPSNRADEERAFDDLLNMALFLRDEVFDVRRQRKSADWDSIHGALTKYVGNDKAPHALIVDVAQHLGRPLQHIAQHPKRVLRRNRGQERIQRVREMDRACFIDLCQRPGMTVAEKAGPRQRVKAVRRVESVDVLENRVALHALHLATAQAGRYIDDYGSIANSPRVDRVTRLGAMLRQIARSPTWIDVPCPTEPVRLPNYVLLQNPAYRKVWEIYQDLIM